MFGIECLRSVLIALPLDNIVPPHVPIVVPLNVLAGALDNQYIADLRQVCNGLIDCDLEAIGLTSAVPTIGGDNNFDTAVLNTVSDGSIRHSVENLRMSCPVTSASQHGEYPFSDHGHLYGYAISGLDAKFNYRVGGFAPSPHEISVGDG